MAPPRRRLSSPGSTTTPRAGALAVGYGNGVRTAHTYDPLSMRLTQCRTVRGTEAMQDLGYVYDPVGNITHIQDDAQQTLFFNNQVVTPSADYTYDAVYRLRRAEGREHIGQASQPETTWNDDGRVHLPHPGDGQAMRRYAEQYGYDAVGNLRELVHTAANGGWTRRFSYDEASLIEPGTASNRLSSVVVGNGQPERFGYDAHGNMTAMAHLPGMEWDFRDQLRRVDLGGGGTAYYVYDAAGERVRTVVEKQRREPRRGTDLPGRLRDLPPPQRRRSGLARTREPARDGRRPAHRARGHAHPGNRSRGSGPAGPLSARQPPRLGHAGARRRRPGHQL